MRNTQRCQVASANWACMKIPVKALQRVDGVTGSLILDVMPTDERILGFSNRWYGPAIGAAQTIRVGRHDIRVVTTPYFLATKLEAFHGRGGHDYRASHDLEDIITVIDGRPELAAEVRTADADVRDYNCGTSPGPPQHSGFPRRPPRPSRP